MKITEQRKKDFIVNARTYLENAMSDPYIKEQILSQGYDDTRMQEGFDRQKKAENAREKQLMIKRTSKSLNTQLKDKFARKIKYFTDDVRLLQSVFYRDIGMKEKLNLYGRKKRTIAGYLEQVRTLYNTLLQEPTILEKLVKLNITSETIQAKLKEIDELEQSYNSFKETNKGSQDATDERNKDFEKLRDWIRIFQNSCRIALRERPQLLEKVGILVRSTKPRRKGSTPSAENGSTPPAAEGTATPATEETENPAPEKKATPA